MKAKLSAQGTLDPYQEEFWREEGPTKGGPRKRWASVTGK